MKRLLKILAGLSLCAGCSVDTPVEPVKAQGESILLDVRTPEEFAARHLPGSLLLPLDRIEAEAGTVLPNKNAAIQVFCRSGRRSRAAKSVLERMGYTSVTDLGGIDDAAKILHLTPINAIE